MCHSKRVNTESVITDNSLVVCWSCVQVLWTGRPCQNFHLLLCIAVLVSEKTVLIENNFGFTEILKVCRPCTFTSIVFDVSQNDAWIYTADDWRINVKIRYSLCLIFVNVLNNDIETSQHYPWPLWRTRHERSTQRTQSNMMVYGYALHWGHSS